MLRAGYRGGHGIHSPFVYDLVRNVVFNRSGLRVPEAVKSYHRELAGMKAHIRITGQGAGSRVTTQQERRISSVVKRSSVTQKQGALLYRLCRWYGPSLVTELGSGLGISTAYLSAGAGSSPVVSIEGSPEKYAFAIAHQPAFNEGVTEFIMGGFDRCFPPLLERISDKTIIFIDGDHRYQPTIEKVQALLQMKGDGIRELMIILDDIYWSDEMEKAWKALVADQRVNISMDLFHMGILFVRPGIAKQHFNVFF